MFGLFSMGSKTYAEIAYNFKFNGIDGKQINLADYENKVLVVVNVASRCGFTSQYSDLQKVWEDYKDKNVVIVDDMVDTAGTLTKAADLMIDRGAKSVRAVCTHALLSGDAYERIEKSMLKELIVTDSIPQKKESKKVNVITCAELFSDVMHNVNNNQSINPFFIK